MIKVRRQHKRKLPFYIANVSFMRTLLKNQIEIASSNPNNKHNLLFCNKDGSFITAHQLTDVIKRACRELGIKTELPTGCTIHMCKHTFVSRCIEAGIKLITISSLVGTSTTELEKTYVHILNKFRNKELENLTTYYKENNIKLQPLIDLTKKRKADIPVLTT